MSSSKTKSRGHSIFVPTANSDKDNSFVQYYSADSNRSGSSFNSNKHDEMFYDSPSGFRNARNSIFSYNNQISHDDNSKNKYSSRNSMAGFLSPLIASFRSLSSFINEILKNKESKSIFVFLLVNLGYMFVQLIYGYMNNSLGLVSDAIHMFFDCIALTVGLSASVISKWPSNRLFTLGYGRIELISGLINGIFLAFISMSIFWEAISRLIYPQEMGTSRLLLVSVGGLLVNLLPPKHVKKIEKTVFDLVRSERSSDDSGSKLGVVGFDRVQFFSCDGGNGLIGTVVVRVDINKNTDFASFISSVSNNITTENSLVVNQNVTNTVVNIQNQISNSFKKNIKGLRELSVQVEIEKNSI
ncbi:putative zinc transporter cis4 [Smittium culicis]|uniref:Putative zinc transporter cis4 n=1 Tax=Smittium culicis TaxID=133412 RepID=A0A1R1YLG0_9FUNG|nr:putative zinc transporter cis4 [Smittium culicis]